MEGRREGEEQGGGKEKGGEKEVVEGMGSGKKGKGGQWSEGEVRVGGGVACVISDMQHNYFCALFGAFSFAFCVGNKRR